MCIHVGRFGREQVSRRQEGCITCTGGISIEQKLRISGADAVGEAKRCNSSNQSGILRFFLTGIC